MTTRHPVQYCNLQLVDSHHDFKAPETMSKSTTRFCPADQRFSPCEMCHVKLCKSWESLKLQSYLCVVFYQYSNGLFDLPLTPFEAMGELELEVQEEAFTRLIQYVSTDATKDYNKLLQKVQDIGGIRQGKYRVTCRVLSRKKMMDGFESQRMYMVQFSNKKELAYLASLSEKKFPLAASGFNVSAHDRLEMLECGIDAAATICGLEIYALKMDAQFDGTLFTIGDFQVAVCIFKTRNNFPKGITIEIQYRPAIGSEIPPTALMDEFQALLGTSETIKPLHDNWKGLFGLVEQRYSIQKALQYIVALVNMRN